jgi:hypothetical protein
MPDVITAVSTGTSFAPHPEGGFPMVCVDTIDLGEKVEQFPGSPAKIVHKCAVVFQSGEKNEEGRLFDLSAEYTVSMYETAALRKLLEAWRGKAYTEEQAKQGVPVHKLVGQAALIQVTHKTSGKGRTYAKVGSIMPLPKGMSAPTLPAYTRADFWAERKAEYAAEVAKHRGSQFGDEYPNEPGDADDTDLPFSVGR